VDIVITEWALDSYLDLLHGNVFARDEYKNDLRPAVLKLRDYPKDPVFQNSKFWSPAVLMGAVISCGFKMKWHQVGNGKVQLRLPVAIVGGTAFLCCAYVKENAAKETKALIRFEQHVELIKKSKHTERGRL